ncbi:hypothetical protein [Candidatus Burkholderia verschuerenii]|uniref:hypothetical protein n=1 Tax=Candidatus Burkholderia verschuerenii TaxID=242163 RepID=UPI001E457DC5|nr:hypothetical protein [Candidatus Burkholderia verschuerenii]
MRSLARDGFHDPPQVGSPSSAPPDAASDPSDALADAPADANGCDDVCSNMLPRFRSVRASPSSLRPNAALRSAPQVGQLSAFLRIVLPQRWQTTENMDAGNVKRVVMLKALEGHMR